MRISDWSSDVCSSDLPATPAPATPAPAVAIAAPSDSGAIRVRAGEHPGFSRLVFDWPQSVPYQITRDGTDALVTFSQAARLDIAAVEIGRASCRERVCPYVSIPVVAVSFKKQKTI